MDRHAEDEIGVVRDRGDLLGLGLRVEGDPRLQTVFVRSGDRDRHVVDSLEMKRDAVTAGRGERLEVLRRVLDHQMDVDRPVAVVDAGEIHCRTIGPIVIGSTK